MASASVPPAAVADASASADATRAAWINVVVAAVIMVATLPGRTQGLGLITEPMLGDLQLDRIAYANINLWATLAGAAICLPIGRLFDRLGLRSATFLLTLLLGLVVWAMSRMAGGLAVLFLLVLATRAIGQSALSVASITAVGKSFGRRVGFAMGVYSVLLTMLFAAAFTYVGAAVRMDGWRTAWASVAVGLFAAAPLTLFLRERTSTADGDAQVITAADVSLAEALRTPAFWIFSGATALFGLASSGLGLFNEAVLAERGFDQETYVSFLAGTAVIGLVGQFGCGWLTLQRPMTHLLGVAMFIYAVALALIPLLVTLTQLWIVAGLIGISGGMITVIFFAIWRRAFGHRQLGRIQGAAQMLTVVASAVGPLIFAQSERLVGSYLPALWGLAPCVLVLGVAAFRTKLPDPSATV